MRSGLVAFVSATALSLSSGANAGRACLNGTTTSTGSYEWRLSDFRYDGPYPGKDIQWSTIVANLGGTSETPLFECAVRWPECWAGWKEGGSNIIWSECIWIGDGDDASVDKTISFAVDWKSRIMYLSHTFACSDKGGSDGLAMGSIRLDLNCTTTRETSYCVQASTDTGARPSIRINTTLLPGPLNASAACTANSEVYQSWRLEKWFQQYEVSSWLVQPPSDIGPSFTLRSMANSDVFSCATLSRQNLTFHGTCKALAGSSSTSTGFRFDDQLNILTIYERWNCSSLTSWFDAFGVAYMQVTCDRDDDLLTCTSDLTWIGTEKTLDGRALGS